MVLTKIRNSHVTNSSSSSFIIGKKDDTSVTIESVYQMINGFYKEYLDKRDMLINYINSKPKLGLEYVKSETSDYFYFKFIKNGKENWNKNNQIEKQIRKDFGISTYDAFDPNYDWLNCDTYSEYEKYWIKNSINHRHAPFTIADFLESKEVNWVHECYKGECNKDLHVINSKSDVLSWYYSWIEEAFGNSCINCNNLEWCDREDQNKCNEQKIMIRDKQIPEDKACLYLLGRVCIYSECGYIPDYVVQKLYGISEYSCNHMG